MDRHRCAAKANEGSSRTPRQFLARAVRLPHRSDEALSAMPWRPINRRWTPADDELLVKLLREGKSFVIVARRMKRTPLAVRHRAGRLRSEPQPGERG